MKNRIHFKADKQFVHNLVKRVKFHPKVALLFSIRHYETIHNAFKLSYAHEITLQCRKPSCNASHHEIKNEERK